ncbi:MAG: glycosyltransferase, partial [Alphaproteobacteria bacterium]|nr:glycosyltransferase [Alphaproteobacteria bacterium]
MKEYTHARTADRPARAFSDRARLSVVIVNFNAGAYLAAAVESLLAQEEPPFEIIVIDNASTDDSLDTLAKVSIQT